MYLLNSCVHKLVKYERGNITVLDAERRHAKKENKSYLKCDGHYVRFVQSPDEKTVHKVEEVTFLQEVKTHLFLYIPVPSCA